MTQAHRLMTRLIELAPGRAIIAEVPMVDDLNALMSELVDCGIAVSVFDVPDRIDVKAIREQTGLSQAKFALNYALDEDTVKNWEQGRTKPDHTARAYLSMIAFDPETVRKMLVGAIHQQARVPSTMPMEMDRPSFPCP